MNSTQVKDAEKDAQAQDEPFRERKKVTAKLQTFMDCEEIPDVYKYVQHTVTAARNAQIVLSTLDGLG